MRGFNLREYRLRLAEGGSEPLDWASVPGSSSAEKKKALQQEFNQGLGLVPNPFASAYRSISPHANGGDMQPLYARFQQLKALAESKEKAEAAEVLQAFGGDVRTVIDLALAQIGSRYFPEIADLFAAQRTGNKVLEGYSNVADIEAKQRALKAYRDQQVLIIREEIKSQQSEWAAEYDVTEMEFCHLVRRRPLRLVGEVEGAFIQKIGDESTAQKIWKRADAICYTRVSNLERTHKLGQIWSGVRQDEEAKSICPVPMPISTEKEILIPMGLTFLNYPSQPEDEFQVPNWNKDHIGDKQLSPEALKERTELRASIRNDAHNLNKLEFYIREGGFENGDGLAKIFRKGVTMSDMTTYAERVLYYVFTAICRSNPTEFKEMLRNAGYEELTSKTSEKIIPDPVFEGFNMSFRSAAEKRCVDKLRNTFGLMAVPYPISIPSPRECPTNSQAFIIDFAIPCDVLQGWNTDEAGMMHPKVSETVVFVGEYFGFDFSKEIQIPQNEDWIDIDGQTAKAKDSKGNETEMKGGATVTTGMKYNLRSNWKRMTETFVAHATGHKALHIDKDLRDRPIMNELDRSHIVYTTKACAPNDPTCSIGMHQLIAHAQECNDPQCDVHRYVKDQVSSHRTFDPREAYVLSALADLKIQYGFIPVMNNAYNNGFNREDIYKFYTMTKKYEELLRNIRAEYETAIRMSGKDSIEARDLLRRYMQAQAWRDNIKKNQIGKLVAEFETHTTSSPDYMKKEQGLNAILAQVRMQNHGMSGTQIKAAVDQFVRPGRG